MKTMLFKVLLELFINNLELLIIINRTKDIFFGHISSSFIQMWLHKLRSHICLECRSMSYKGESGLTRHLSGSSDGQNKGGHCGTAQVEEPALQRRKEKQRRVEDKQGEMLTQKPMRQTPDITVVES